MKTQTNIGKTKKWAILFIVLMAVSATIYAQPSVKSGYDREIVSMVEKAWNSLDQLAINTENHIRYEAPAVDDNPENCLIEQSPVSINSSIPVLLVESSQERKDELTLNPRSGKDVVEVGYYQNSSHTTWYKIRNIVTKKPAVKCNVCTKVVSTPYVIYMKPRVK